nr:hypothetical protein [Actinomadura sp. RB99]
MAVAAFFPAAPPRTGTAFTETARRHGDYALSGVAAVVTLDEDLRVGGVRAGYLGIAPAPLVLDLAEAAGPHGDWPAAAAYVRERIDPESDIHASARYRRHLTGVLTERALATAAAEALRRARD